MPERLCDLPSAEYRRTEHDFSFLSDGEPWLLVRGVDFEPELTLWSVRRRIREWATTVSTYTHVVRDLKGQAPMASRTRF